MNLVATWHSCVYTDGFDDFLGGSAVVSLLALKRDCAISYILYFQAIQLGWPQAANYRSHQTLTSTRSIFGHIIIPASLSLSLRFLLYHSMSAIESDDDSGAQAIYDAFKADKE